MQMYSKESYRSLLALALQQGYKFVGFLDKRNIYDRCIYLRHDVDYSLRMALELAEINASLGIQSTFCLLLRSQVYNLLSHWSLDYARKIHALGQHLAFHYSVPPTIPACNDELAALILADFNIVKHHLSEIELVFSWHNPTAELINRGLHLEVPGLVNIYSTHFVKDIQYYSDSNMRYSVTEFETIISQQAHPGLHLLFHPLNWVAGGSNMLEVLGTTWKYVIRERELEMGTNRCYTQAMPEGMPQIVLDEFVEQWCRAAGKDAGDVTNA